MKSADTLRGTAKNLASLAAIAAISCAGAGCATMKTAGKVLATPVAVARDVIDVPLALAANTLEDAAASNRGYKYSRMHWKYGKGAPTFESDVNIACPFVEAGSYLFGAIDYALCRSFVPFPKGSSPWAKKEKGQKFVNLLFTNTEYLWREKPYSAKEALEAEIKAEKKKGITR